MNKKDGDTSKYIENKVGWLIVRATAGLLS
jgi:hypothetical protein